MIVFLSLLISLSHAGFLRMQSESGLKLEKHGSDLVLSGTYQIENQGDESAFDVFPELSLDQFRWQGQAVELKASEKFVWSVSQVLTPESLCSKEAPPTCLVSLPEKGQYLIRVRKFYRDQNGYPFVVPDISQIVWPEGTPTENSIQLSVYVTSADNQNFEANYQISNLSSEKIALHLEAHLPDEVEILGPPQRLELEPKAQQTGILGFRNLKGVTNSEYILHLTAQWQQNGRRQLATTSGAFRIQPQEVAVSPQTVDQRFFYWFCLCLSLSFIAFWVFWIRPVQKLNS